MKILNIQQQHADNHRDRFSSCCLFLVNGTDIERPIITSIALGIAHVTLKTRFQKKFVKFMVISVRKLTLKVMEAISEVDKSSVITVVSNREVFFEEMYESVFPAVAAFVKEMRGSYQDAKDIFQDALIIYFEKLSENRLNVKVSAERYILGISKHLWLRKFKDDRKKITLDNFERALYLPEDFYPNVSSSRLLQFLEAAGSKCLDLLRGFYFEKIPLKAIANQFGYGSEHSAAVQKYKCLEKIRESINERSITYEDFFE